MAQSGFTPIQIYSSSTTGNTPAAGNLLNSTGGSELAINIFDGKLFYKDNAGAVQVIGWKIVPVSAGGTGQTSYTDGQLLIGNSTGNTLTKATLTAGSGVTITNGAGAITINATGSGGTVTSVSGTAPVSVATGTTTPVISLASGYGDTQNPYASKTANYVLAAPNGSAGVPTFRALVSADIPSLSSIYIPYTGASAAIDLNAQTVVNIAHLGIGTTSVPTILLRAVGDNNSTSRIAVRGYSSNANSSAIRITKFRGTVAAPQAPQSGDSLGKFEFAGYGTTSSEGYPQASFEGLATETWGAIARGAKTVIKVTPNTTTTQVVAVTIDQNSAATFASSVTATSFSGSGASLTSIPNSALVNSTISGVALGGSLFNLTAGTGVSFSAGTTYNGSTAITINATGTGGTVTSVAALTLGTSGTDLSSTVANGTTTPVITLNVPTASATNRGALSAADWTTFNNKQPAGTYVTNLTGPITSVGNATSIASQTGTGTKFVVDNTPTLITPVLGVATATSINKMAITAPATSSTLAVADSKTFTASNTLTLAGTDSTTMTFPTTSATIARTDAAQTFTGDQKFINRIAVGTSTITGIINATGGNGAAYIDINNSSSGNLFQIENNSGAHNIYCTGAIPFNIYVNGTLRTVIDANGGLKTQNTIGVGAATPSASGAGITFPATQSASTDANTLDDYEEGTWTPTFNSITGSPTGIARYVKIGKQVTLTFEQDGGTFTCTGGLGTITGIPFLGIGGAGTVSACGTISNTVVTSALALYNASSTGTMYVAATFAAAAGVGFSITYFV
jgi:hypothetical protein